MRITDTQAAALQALANLRAVGDSTASEAPIGVSANTLNRLYSGGLVGRATGPRGGRWWITQDGDAALVDHARRKLPAVEAA